MILPCSSCEHNLSRADDAVIILHVLTLPWNHALRPLSGEVAGIAPAPYRHTRDESESRNHIHFSKGLPEDTNKDVISGMRNDLITIFLERVS